MSEKEEAKPIPCSMRNCNYDARYFESGFFWCKYCYWVDSLTPSRASLKYLDVIAC